MILITGATGNLGSKVIENLLKKTSANQIVALAQNEEKAKTLQSKGVNVRIGNYDDTASLDSAMEGIEKVLLISGNDIPKREQQHKNVIDSAKKAGVKYIAYTSFSIRDIENSALKGMMESHFPTEEYLKESGVSYTILRNNYYADVISMFIGEKETILNNGIVFPAGDGKVPYSLRSEMAEAFANVLLNSPEHENKTYDISNVEAYSFNDIATEISNLSGKEISYTDIDTETFTNILKSLNLADWMIGASLGTALDMKNNQNSIVSNDLQNLLGRKPADLKSMLKEVYQF